MVRGRVIGLFLVGVCLGCFDPNRKSGEGEDDGSSSSDGGGASTSMEATGNPSSGESDPSVSGSETGSGPTSGDDESSTGGPPPIPCPGGDGLPDPECVDDDAPFCLDGFCVGCTEVEQGTCESLDPTLPACLPSGACGLCSANEQCGSQTCRFATGECIPEASHLRVDAGADCAAGDGAEATPFCTLQEAEQLIDTQPPGSPWAIFLAPGAYTATVDASPEHAISILGPAAGALPTVESQTLNTFDTGAGELYLTRLIASDSDSAGSAVVQNGGTLRLEDVTLVAGETVLDLRSGESDLLRVLISSDALLGVDVGASATSVFDQVTIESNGGAMHSEGDVTLRRSNVRNNYVDGGIDVPSGTLRIENSFIHDNLYVRGAIDAGPAATVEILYSTIMDEVECNGGQFTIRNSIVLGLDLCGSSDIDNSAVDAGYVAQGQGNVALDPAQLAAHFVNPGGVPRDFHLLPGGEFASLGVWQVGDPTIDIDGDARPEVALATDAAGADVP